jgi:ribonuclease HI
MENWEGLAMAFEYAAKAATPMQEIRVHADNQAAIYRLRIPSDKPAQTWQLRCIKACKEVISKEATISIFWVPGHEDVTGNERADALAKQATMLDFSHTEITSLAMTGMSPHHHLYFIELSTCKTPCIPERLAFLVLHSLRLT